MIKLGSTSACQALPALLLAVFSRNREIRWHFFASPRPTGMATFTRGHLYILNSQVSSSFQCSKSTHPLPQHPRPSSENNFNHSFALQRRLRPGCFCPFPHLGLLFSALAALHCEYMQQSTITEQPDCLLQLLLLPRFIP